MIVVDANAIVLEWNAAAARIFGYSRDDILGRSLELFFTHEDLQRGELATELAVARSYGKGENDRWMQRKDGSRFWAHGTTTPVMDDASEVVGFLKILRDRTDIRAQLDTLKNRLEAAEQAVRRRDVFLATVAHELRNPLATTKNTIRLMRVLGSTRLLEQPLEVMERQLGLIERLIDDVGDATRIATGKLTLERETVDVRAIIEQALLTCSAVLDAKEQNVEILASSPIMIEADPLRLAQIIVNLLVNAAKFSPVGSKVWIKATVEGSEAVIRVEDRGAGIPQEFLPHMFEFFTQAETTGESLAHGPSRGMGLGLPLVKSLVELHHGTVQARSEGAGKGAEISVRLPLKQPRAAN